MSTRQSKTPRDLFIALHIPFAIKADYSYGTQAFAFGFVTVARPEGLSLQVRNPSDMGPLAAFEDLQIRCQASSDMCEGKPYAFHTEYHGVHSVNPRDCERMSKMFKRLAKVEAGFAVQPETFGQYVQMICQGLKVDTVIQDRGAGNWHTETEHAEWKVSELQWLIDRKIGEFLTENATAMAASRRY